MNEASSSLPPDGGSKKHSSKDRWVKIGFLLVILIGVVGVYLLQHRSLSIKDWGDDLPAALREAKATGRMVVVFFVEDPPSETSRRIKDSVIHKPGNRKALKEGNFIRVIVILDNSLKSDVAKQYRIKELPTLMVLRPNGTERNRHEGLIGEVNFRQDLLQYPPPEQPTSPIGS
jgi:hypothetical protein